MRPPGHAVISLSIGGVLWAITKSPYAMASAFVAGVFIDLDHLVEYYWWFIKEDRSRVLYFLHSYELLVPAFLSGYLSGWNPVVLGASMAFLGHLMTDQIVNPVVPFGYFFTYRAMKRFRRDSIVNVRWPELEEEFLRIPVSRRVLSIFNPKLKQTKSRGGYSPTRSGTLPVRNFTWEDTPALSELANLAGRKDGSDLEVTDSSFIDKMRQPNLYPEQDCFLFEDGTQLRAYSLLQRELPIRRAVLEIEVHPDYRESGVEREIIIKGLERAKAVGAPVLHICVGPSEFWSSLLESEGFKRVRQYWVMEWEAEQLPPMDLPPGYVIQSFQPGDEDRLTRTQNAAFEASWGFCPNTVEEIAYRLTIPRDNPPEIVFLSNEGDTAGYCWTAINESSEKTVGFIEMVGVAPDYRGRGLGKPTALAGMHRLNMRGARSIRLNVDEQNTPAKAMYTSIGFKKTQELHWFEAQVSEG